MVALVIVDFSNRLSAGKFDRFLTRHEERALILASKAGLPSLKADAAPKDPAFAR
jgi:hypothetical protein